MYRLCGLTLATEFSFPELEKASAEAADFTFAIKPDISIPAEKHQSVIHDWCFPNGEPWLSIAKAGEDYILTFPQFATFLISADARRIICDAHSTPPDTIRHLFLDQVVPVLLSAWGKLVLHASGVASPEGVLGFIGAAGAGKSTMAATFWAEGFPVVTDDCLIVEPAHSGFAVRPNYPGLRLWPETVDAVLGGHLRTSEVAHYTRKKRVAVGEIQSEMLPLRRLYLLAECESSPAISIETLPPAEAFIELIKYTFRLDITDRKRLAEEFGPFSKLVASGRVKRLRYPRDVSVLPEVKAQILADAANAERPAPTLA